MNDLQITSTEIQNLSTAMLTLEDSDGNEYVIQVNPQHLFVRAVNERLHKSRVLVLESDDNDDDSVNTFHEFVDKLVDIVHHTMYDVHDLEPVEGA